jgi:uncharacterized paraquat-inducible protein A
MNGPCASPALRSVTAALGCALGTFLLRFPSNLSPLLSVSIFGMHTQTRLGSGVAMFWAQGWVVLAGLTGAFAVMLPSSALGSYRPYSGRLGYFSPHEMYHCNVRRAGAV